MRQDQRIVAIVQARTGSTRLPRKVLMEIAGQPMLTWVIRRLQRAKRLHEVIVATTMAPADEAIINECKHLGVPAFRGDEEDVLDRYVQAAATHQAGVVVRVTSDCPLIDPGVVDHIVGAFLDEGPDYASNTIMRTYPRGLDVEVMTGAALARAGREATKPYQRAHVTPYLYQHPDLFRLLSITADADYSRFRWTVDTLEDLSFVRAIVDRFHPGNTWAWRDVVRLVTEDPTLAALNSCVRQKMLQEG